MYSEARKLHLIEEVLKISSESTLVALEDIVKKSKQSSTTANTNSFKEFAGIWSNEEATEIEKAIADSCEQIDPNDWK